MTQPSDSNTIQYNPYQGMGRQVAGNLLSVGLQSIINRRAERRQFSRNLSMWKMQNEYNSPQAQMQRLKEAGLNPNLMYGKGTVGNAQTLPQYNAIPTQGMSEVFGKSVAGLQGMMSIEATELQNENQDIQNKKEKINLEYQRKFKEVELITNETKRDIAISNLNISFYNEQIARINANQKKHGIDGASTEYKALFQHMYENLTTQELSNAVRNMALTSLGYKALKDVVGATLVGNIFKKQNSKSFNPSGYSKTSKNFYPKGKGTTLNEMYKGPGQ